MISETLPQKVGYDFSGEIVECGSKVTKFAKGDKIAGLLEVDKKQSGSFSEFVAVSEEDCIVKIPNGKHSIMRLFILTFDEIFHNLGVSPVPVAGLGLAGITALWCMKPRVKKDDIVIVRGASGGVGHFAVQIARKFGAKQVIAISSHEEFCRSIGATKVVNYKNVDWFNVLKDTKADVFIDCIGGKEGECFNFKGFFNHLLNIFFFFLISKGCPKGKQCLKPNGVFIPVAIDLETKPTHMSMMSVLLSAINRKFWAFVSSEPAYDMFVSHADTPMMQELMSMVEKKEISVKIDEKNSPKTFTLESMVEMFRAQTDGKSVCGKLVLEM